MVVLSPEHWIKQCHLEADTAARILDSHLYGHKFKSHFGQFVFHYSVKLCMLTYSQLNWGTESSDMQEDKITL